MPKPTPAQVAAATSLVQSASPSAIEDAMLQLRTDHFPAARWLGVGNRYARRTVERLWADSRAGRSPKKSQLCQYIAASTILHCFDGWSFLSRSAESIVSGDVASAIHLAYYAELRATMSFLGAAGIGVFNTKHFGYDSAGTLAVLDGLGTHDAAWLIMDKWADVPANSSRLLGLITVQGRSLLEWMEAAGYSASSPTSYALARNWLKQWSMDLAIVSGDHNARNLASYRPQRLISPPDSPTSSVLCSLVGFWEACEPSGFEHFRLLDWHLLRRAVEWSYFASTNQTPTGPRFVGFVDGIILKLGLAETRMIRDFLLKRTQPTIHPLLIQAKKKAERHNVVLRPLPVFARALLLLRLASSAAEHLFEGRSISATELAFWVNPLGEQRGLWDAGAAPNQMADLWEDIRPNLDLVAEWCESALPTSNIYQARSSLTNGLAELTRFERVALWAVGL